MFTDDQRAALDALGIAEDRWQALLRGEATTSLFGGGASPMVIVAQLRPPRLRAGVIEINASGRGMYMLLEFRSACEVLARSFELTELELFGAAVVSNQPRLKLEPGKGAKTLSLKSVALGNGKSMNDAHMGRATITLIDDNHYAAEWAQVKDGKPVGEHVAKFNMARKAK